MPKNKLLLSMIPNLNQSRNSIAYLVTVRLLKVQMSLHTSNQTAQHLWTFSQQKIREKEKEEWPWKVYWTKAQFLPQLMRNSNVLLFWIFWDQLQWVPNNPKTSQKHRKVLKIKMRLLNLSTTQRMNKSFWRWHNLRKSPNWWTNYNNTSTCQHNPM